jgi:hypothetical protein
MTGPALPPGGFLRDQFLDLGEGTQAQPGSQSPFELPVSGQDERACVFCPVDCGVAHPDLGHGPEIGRQIKIDVEPWVH